MFGAATPHIFRFHKHCFAGNIPLVGTVQLRESDRYSGAKRERDEDDLDRSLCDRPVGIGEFGLGSAGCAGCGTGGRRTLLVAAADPPSPPSRPRTPFAVALVGP